MAEEPNLQMAEDEDLERAKAFWKENGKSIVAGVVLGVGAIGGWNGWQYWQKTEGENASTLYQNLSSADIEPEAAKSLADELMADYSGTPYASNGALMAAKQAVENGDYAEARRYLEWVVENAGNEALQHVARLRLAQVALGEGQPDRALTVIGAAGGAANEGPFAARYQELTGDAEALAGNNEAAEKAWTTSLELLDVGSQASRLVQLKLDNLGKL